LDRESAYEILKKRSAEAAAEAAEAEIEPPPVARGGSTRPRADRGEAPAKKPAARRSDSVIEATIKSTMRSAGSQIGRSLVRGILGSLFKGR